MSAGRYPIYIEQGTTIDFEIQYKDSTGAPVDLTGYGARMQIRPSATSETVYLSLTSTPTQMEPVLACQVLPLISRPHQDHWGFILHPVILHS